MPGKYDDWRREYSIHRQHVVHLPSSSACTEGYKEVGERSKSTRDMAQRARVLVVDELFEKLKKIGFSGSCSIFTGVSTQSMLDMMSITVRTVLSRPRTTTRRATVVGSL